MIVKPSVSIISRPRLDVDQVNQFLKTEKTSWKRTPNATEAEEIIEFAGRVCYLSFGDRQSPKTNADYIKNLIFSGHESVLEHASWSLLITDVSRAFTHQLVRHRVGVAFSQLSQQYHDEAGARFVAPHGLEASPEAADIWNEHTEASMKAYREISGLLLDGHRRQELGITKKEYDRLIRSVSRSVLPNATETKIVMTANARALRHFLRVRGDIAGDYEMRLVSAELFKLLKTEAPAVFFDFKLKTLDDGSPRVVLALPRIPKRTRRHNKSRKPAS